MTIATSAKKTSTRAFAPRVGPLECRITPVLANTALAPLVPAGAGFDGVVLITTTIGDVASPEPAS